MSRSKDKQVLRYIGRCTKSVRAITAVLKRAFLLSRDFRLSGIVGAASLLLLVIVIAVPHSYSPRQDHKGRFPSKDATVEATIPTFRDDTLVAGITFSHLQGDEHLTGLNETLGGGACALDYDNDGWVDLFLVNGTGQTRYYGSQHWWHLPKGNALYRNLGGGRFVEVTKTAGLSAQFWGMGCAAADLDNDGDADLLLTNYDANVLYRNNGNGTFTNITGDSGIVGENWSTSAALADFDGDGFLDIYITNYLDFHKGAHTYEAASQFLPEHPRSFFAHLYVAQANRLYRNLGGLKFEDVTERAGVQDASGRGLSAAWLDINNDRRPDLLVANDMGTTNVAFINRGDGRFDEAGIDYLLNDARGAHGLSAGDINADGVFDVAVSTSVGEPPLILVSERTEDRSRRVFRNRSRHLGVGTEATAAFSGWGLTLQDFNNDGGIDVFQAGGLLTPDPDTYKLPQGQSKRLWLQQPNGSFRDVSENIGRPAFDRQSARGIAVADFDNDGDLDIYVAHNNELGQLLTNQTARGHWLGVKLEGSRSNRDAVGAVVRVRTGDGREQRRLVDGNGFLSSSDRRLHFGLGEQTRVTELKVTWPDGTKQAYRNVGVDRYLHILEGQSTARELQYTKTGLAQASRLGLRIARARPVNRMHYLEWIVDTYGISVALPELAAGIKDDDARVRSLVVELLKRNKRPESLALLVGALEDADVDVRLQAIDAVRQYEDEASVRWLLRTFYDPDPRARVAIANAFKYFFNKEEAVIFRKYLALPYLIRLLDDPVPAVRRAAAAALGAAERYRAIEPLLARLADPDVQVRAEAVCSLGLIRDKKVVTALQTALSDPRQPPLVRAHALIGLKRLNASDESAFAAMSRAAVRRAGKPAVRDLLEIAKEIFSNAEHGVVISRRHLFDLLHTVAIPEAAADPSLRQLAVTVLEAAGGPHAVEPLRHLSRDPDPAVRERAYVALITVDHTRRASHYESALRDASIDLRERLLHRLATDNVVVPAGALLANLDDPRTRSPAVRALRGTANPTAIARLHHIATDEAQPTALRIDALDSLTAAAKQAAALPDAVLVASDPHLRAAAMRFWAARMPAYINTYEPPAPIARALRDADRTVHNAAIDILQKRHEAWASRYLTRALLDQQVDIGVRRRILDGFSNKAAQDAEQALLRIARLRHDPLRIPAINALIRSDSVNARHLLWEILRDPLEEEDIRFIAARGLKSDDQKAVIEVLRTG